jgi:hypothetical protein
MPPVSTPYAQAQYAADRFGWARHYAAEAAMGAVRIAMLLEAGRIDDVRDLVPAVRSHAELAIASADATYTAWQTARSFYETETAADACEHVASAFSRYEHADLHARIAQHALKQIDADLWYESLV